MAHTTGRAWLTFDLYTPNDDERPVYIAGNFNNWSPKGNDFQMQKVDEGHYRLQLMAPLLIDDLEEIEYKYVKHDWSGEELTHDGLPSRNRQMSMARGMVSDVVSRWKINPGSYSAMFFPDIRIVSKRFDIPQLGAKRRISVLLPWNYEQNSEKHYPVIYLQDGQNLFDHSSPYGSWKLDDQLAMMAQYGRGNFIVVAIDHGGQERIKEYSPYITKLTPDGLGIEYASFLAETLKPYIDQNFRTLADWRHTAIGGSSMGGLISIFAGISYPHLFSKYLIFSPSLWLSKKIYEESEAADWNKGSRVYLYVGANEGQATVENVGIWGRRMKAVRPDLDYEIKMDPNGTHQEAFWGKAFPEAMDWLFGELIQD